MRPPNVRVNNVNVARLERLSRAREKADLQVGHISMIPDGAIEDDATPEMKRAYERCAAAWGEDERWLDPETRCNSKYGIHQYGTGVGDLIEIQLRDVPGVPVLEVDTKRLVD